MSRFIITDGSYPGFVRLPKDEHRKASGVVGSQVLNEAQAKRNCGYTPTVPPATPPGIDVSNLRQIRSFTDFSRAMFLSNDGRYLATEYGQIGGGTHGWYFSNNFGASWTTKANGSTIADVCGSRTGQRQFYISNYSIFVSNDFGATFTEVVRPAGWTSLNNISCSDDGMVVAASYYPTAFTRRAVYSLNGGLTWAQTSDANLFETAEIFVSPDGNVFGFSGYGSGDSVFSSDHGATWTALGTGIRTNEIILGSGDKTIFGVGNGTTGKFSSDNGATWKNIGNDPYYYAVGGTDNVNVIVGASLAKLAISIDRQATPTVIVSPLDPSYTSIYAYGCSLNRDGNKLLIVGNKAPFYNIFANF